MENGTEPVDRLKTYRQRGGNTNDKREPSKAKIKTVCYSLDVIAKYHGCYTHDSVGFWPVQETLAFQM